jgi:N-methylhydantoinase A
MRYHGQGHEIEIPLPDRALQESDIAALRSAFEEEYSRQFSRAVPGMTVEILNWAVSVSSEPPALARYPEVSVRQPARISGQRRILCDVTDSWRAADVYDRAALGPGDQLSGPALIVEPQTTTFVSADFAAHVDGGGNIWLQRMGKDRA